MPATPTYAVQADLLDYIAGLVIDNSAEADALLIRCEADIDAVVGFWPLNDGEERKFDPTELDWAEARALKRATCAQFAYRVEMGERFFTRPQYESVSGPDFQTQGKAPIVGPQAMRELAGSGLLRNTTASSRRPRWPSWASFRWNLPDPTDAPDMLR